MKSFIYTKVFQKSFVLFCNINDQHTIPTPLFLIIKCEKMGCNSKLNSVLVQLLGISNTVDGGGPNVKLEK